MKTTKKLRDLKIIKKENLLTNESLEKIVGGERKRARASRAKVD